MKETGRKYNDVQMSYRNGKWKVNGVLSDDGTKITYWGAAALKIGTMEWMTEHDYLAYKDCGDPADAPSSHYNIQPNNLGKLFWISGPPGVGKSTIAQALSIIAGYVYYEGDCFSNHVNPFIPPEAKEPTLAQRTQKPLKNVKKIKSGTAYPPSI